jgi:hypothetical protein
MQGFEMRLPKLTGPQLGHDDEFRWQSERCQHVAGFLWTRNGPQLARPTAQELPWLGEFAMIHIADKQHSIESHGLLPQALLTGLSF